MSAKVTFRCSWLFFTALLFLSALTNCQKTDTNTRSYSVFRYNESAGISSLDPAFARAQNNIWVVHQLYNTLVEYDDQLQIKPSLAIQYSMSDDGLQYHFKLRREVYFHESHLFHPLFTRMVNAYDVVYSLRRLSDSRLAAPGSWTMNYVDKIEAVTEDSLTITLKKPFPPFLGILTMKYCSIVPAEIGNKPSGWLSKNPVGTGPFYLKLWQDNEIMILRKNPRYFERDKNGQQLPYLDAVRISFITEKQSAFLELLNERLDMISGLDASYKDEILNELGQLNPRYQKRFVLQKADYLNTEYLAFNYAKVTEQSNPWSDVRLRKAINLAINKEAIVLYLRNGAGIPARQGFVPPALNPQVVYRESFNPELARQLISSSGIPADDLRLILNTTAAYADMAELIQQDLAKVGIQLQIDVQPPSTLRQNMASGAVTFYRGSWIADYADGENYLSLFYSKNLPPAGPNYARFTDVNFDRWYDELARTTDADRRLYLISRMDSLLMEQAVVIPLMYDQVVRLVHRRAAELPINSINLLELRRLNISAP
ncbi:ABC transporter substrate-binding protein [Schleiferia thermophila str. Yellowstone]|jgi:peptide/nickel transport system substrate-binding protein|uniref:ABC transporter substrate-binding protein n=1 Tax=Schleiferia thermophila TaxID=884107 RepID=UPI0004E6548A|nr:ABC transporter substrate-binding protein [Schleiferia thermophila]KFD38385.1 ABC transporter substrate-binding protein [Schleiferia thermophila str. Yellowstone]PMB23687.1 ABC transporter substrate-binding protein [Fischerella thermalis CCMEE 5319]